MKNLPIIAILGIFVIGATIFATVQMRRIDDSYTSLGQHEVAAALAATRVNRAFANSRAAVGELLLAVTDEGNQLALASLNAARGDMSTYFLAEFERELIVERTRAGLQAARAQRWHGGRLFKMTTSKLHLAQAAMGLPETKIGDLYAELGVTRQTLYRHVDPPPP